jgi:hypothetical protein
VAFHRSVLLSDVKAKVSTGQVVANRRRAMFLRTWLLAQTTQNDFLDRGAEEEEEAAEDETILVAVESVDTEATVVDAS